MGDELAQVPQTGRWIVVDLQAHVIHVYEDGNEVKTIEHFSVGRKKHLTPLYKDVEILPHKRLRHHMSTITHPCPTLYSLMRRELFMPAMSGLNPTVAFIWIRIQTRPGSLSGWGSIRCMSGLLALTPTSTHKQMIFQV